jgi:D-arabinose 1-dehydrogenase-like Zn-dependent alcohol dehydrogenase
VFIEQITITGSFDGTLDEFYALLDFVADARLVPYIGQVLPMERVAEGLRVMLEGRLAGKIVLARHAS